MGSPSSSVAPERGRSRHRNATETRKRILEAAHTLFLQNTYENVSTREIARMAGVDAALIKRYFGSKEGLFREVLSEIVRPDVSFESIQDLKEDMAHSLTEILARGPLDAKAATLRFVLSSALSPSVAPIVAEVFRTQCTAPLEQIFEGPLPRVKAELVSAYIVGILAVFHILGPRDPSQEERKLVVEQFEALIERIR